MNKSKLTKKDLVFKLEQELNLTAKDANKAVEVILKSINETLLNGEDVVLLHTGTLKRVKVKPLKSMFGKEVDIAERYMVKFEMSRTLRQDLLDVSTGKMEKMNSLEKFRNSLKVKKKK